MRESLLLFRILCSRPVLRIPRVVLKAVGDQLRFRSPLPWLVAAVFVPIFCINAYVCDDAFIMLRVVDNLVRGHGMRWNTGERVQVFTSPLHTLLTAIPYAFTHDSGVFPNPTRAYVTSIGLAFFLSILALLEVLRCSRHVGKTLCALAFLLSSQAFVTFTSSGLETPLLYLLLAAFMRRYLWRAWGTGSNPRQQLELLLLFSLIALTRLDATLVVLPAATHIVLTSIRADGVRAVPRIAAASLPLVGWFGFALVYFGVLLPNTYYAKLGVDIDPQILLQMGVSYLGVGLLQDPITITALAVALPASLLRGGTRSVGIGLLLQVGYVVLIGGDFIGLRLIAPHLLVACIAGLRVMENGRDLRGPTLGFTILGFATYNLLVPGSPLRVPVDGPNARDVRYYFEAARLSAWRPDRSFPFAPFHRVSSGDVCAGWRSLPPSVQILDGGLAGFCMGPTQALLSPAGITDPLVARLPLKLASPFYPGHIVKPIPAGYEETVRTHENQISDFDLAAYSSTIDRVTRGPLFAPERWRAIWQLNVSSPRYCCNYVARNPPYPAEFYYRHETLAEEWRRLLR